ncbi:hexamerin 70b-like [Anticarsia gemmatalis]|uniref:hexamerin 70b-like n=1 Tax=Anticarsia gemmatalis TaxID=129554 RepID=UPI003F7637A9
MFGATALIWIICLGVTLSAPTDEFRSIVNEGELSLQNGKHLMGIVPGIAPSSQKSQITWDGIETLLQDNPVYDAFVEYVKNGVTLKGLTFNIYNDDMKEAAIKLFELIRNVNNAGYDAKKLFDFEDINEDLAAYAFDLNILYGEKHPGKTAFVPPFIRKPNFFVNGETIFKALRLSNQLNYNVNNSGDARVNQYYKMDDTIIINTNYSGWNLPHNGGEEELNYFREDISLNSYYYGVHLMHPYWLSSRDLDEIHPRHSEHYYYTHQQLTARLLLEKEHLKQGHIAPKKSGYGDFNPYLVHKNGLMFPLRSNTLGDWSEDRAKIKAVDIAIRECMSRGLIIMDNATTINMTEDNYVDLLAKLIRANYDGVRTSKIIRSLFGYGGNGFPYDIYNPAPSLLHHPETALRDPIYWYMMQYVLNYFTEYKDTMMPYNLAEYETEDFKIVDASIPKITTYFDYYQFNINKAITGNGKLPLTITARQKRLKHSQFTLAFTVDSKVRENVIVRLYLGPPCDNCWEEYSKFFELDTFDFYLQKGSNIINWSPETSSRLSSDEYYNLEGSPSEKSGTNKYNMFKFPENLLIPRGLESGMNLTLFVMITPSGDSFDGDFAPPNHFYGELYNELDSKPLGFPFHRPSNSYKDEANNYKFYNILVHHKQNNVASNGYFSSHLY